VPSADQVCEVIYIHFAKMILMATPPGSWKRRPGRPHITWLNTVQRDLTAYNLTLNEAVDQAQKRPPWRLMSMYGALVVTQPPCSD